MAILPVDDSQVVGVVGGGMTWVCVMAEHATFEAEGALWVTKGMIRHLGHSLVWLVIWSKAVRGRGTWGLWVG